MRAFPCLPGASDESESKEEEEVENVGDWVVEGFVRNSERSRHHLWKLAV